MELDALDHVGLLASDIGRSIDGGDPGAAATFRPPAPICLSLSARAYESAQAEL